MPPLCNFSSFPDISDHPIHCHRINHIPSLCFSAFSSSNTPLSTALQAADERTLLVMVEQRRSPDALDRPDPFISLVPDAGQHGGSNAPGRHKYSLTSAEEAAWTTGRSTCISLIRGKLCWIHCPGTLVLKCFPFPHYQSWTISPQFVAARQRINHTTCHLVFL